MKTEKNIPVFCITGASGTGKTTLLVQLLPMLAKRGIRTAVFKHDAHDTDWDQKGKDSQKLTEAGATVTGLLSVSRTMRIENRSTPLEEIIRETKGVDLILLEGFHDCPYPKIQVYRAAIGKQLRVPPEQCAAMVTDTPFAACQKNFRWEEVDALAEWIAEYCREGESEIRRLLPAERKDRISVEEAQARILQLRDRKDIRAWRESAVESLPVYRCQGRILAESVFARAGHPRFSQSAMDGYALRSEETRHASAEHPVTFRVVGMITAGAKEIPNCGAGEAVRIMTGGKVPTGADCVIRQEAVQICGISEASEGRGEIGEIQISHPVKTGDCICRQEEDFRQGEQILTEGTVLDAGALGLAASAGVPSLQVEKKLRAAILITGSEIIRAGQQPEGSQVFDAMESYLYARMEQVGMSPDICRIAPDDPEQLQRAIKALQEQADVIVTTGGVSVGVHDYMPCVIEDMHGEILFHGIAMKPGMPTMLSVLEDVPVLSLSGNPSAASVAFELFMPYVQEAMRRGQNAESENAITGHEPVLHRTSQVTLATDFEKSSPVRRFLWGYSDGKQVWAAEHQRNGNIRSLVGQNCLIEVPAGSGALKAGQRVKILWLKNVSA